MLSFKDNFSRQAAIYARYRPTYPPELFDYLRTLSASHALAWDCGTGNGQCARGLAMHYEQVYATDPSPQQIANAAQHPRVAYHVEQAEQTPLADQSVDLVTVAHAVHWFRFDAFYAEVKRVLKKDGAIAVWTYGLPVVSPAVDEAVKHLHDNILGEYWQPENRLIEQRYATIPFPFEAVLPPAFTMVKHLTADQFTGWLRTWSAVQRYARDHGYDPVTDVEAPLRQSWGAAGQPMAVQWEIFMRAGR